MEQSNRQLLQVEPPPSHIKSQYSTLLLHRTADSTFHSESVNTYIDSPTVNSVLEIQPILIADQEFELLR